MTDLCINENIIKEIVKPKKVRIIKKNCRRTNKKRRTKTKRRTTNY